MFFLTKVFLGRCYACSNQYIEPSSYMERDNQQRQDSEFRHKANLPSSLTEEMLSETGSNILPLTEFLNQRLVLKLYQLNFCPSHPI